MSNRIRTVALCLAFAMTLAATSFAQYSPTLVPQGRLTLSSTSAVMTSDAAGVSTIYYLGYLLGGEVPLYNASNHTWSYYGCDSRTVTLSSTYQLASNVYDVFAFVNGSSCTLGFGPAWPSTTSRGASSNSDYLQEIGGLWTNLYGADDWTGFVMNNGSTTYAVDEFDGTYLGSVYIPTTAGETTVNLTPSAAAGGNGNVIGIWNAYNRVPINSVSQDSNSTWTLSSGCATADSSTNNRVTWLDGLQQTSVAASYAVAAQTSGTGIAAQTGVDLDSTSATPSTVSDFFPGVTSAAGTLTANQAFSPQSGALRAGYGLCLGYGYHYVLRCQYPYGLESLTLHSEY
jgi:hypothetical protein